MRRILVILGFGLGGVALVLGLTLGAYALIGPDIRQPVRPVIAEQTSPAPHTQKPDRAKSPGHSASPSADDHGGTPGGSSGGTPGSSPSSGSGSTDGSGGGEQHDGGDD